MRRFFSLALAIASCPACYLSHGLGDTPDAGTSDASHLDSAFVDTVFVDTAFVDTAFLDAVVIPPRCSLVMEAELLVASEEDGNLYAPDIFWSGERIGVVMSEDNAGGFEHGIVAMSHVDPELSAAAPRRLVGEESHGWGEAAWNGEGFGVCWSGDPGGESATRFREVSGLDGALGPVTSFGTGNESCLDLVFGHGRYAVAWRRVYRGEDVTLVDAMVRVLARDGTFIGEPINMGTKEYGGYSPTLALSGDGFVALVNNEDSVREVRFDREGRTTSDRRFELPGADYTTFALRGEHIAIATLSGTRETRSLTFRVLGPDFRELSRRVIADGAPNASRPRILARPEGWMLVWGEGSRPSDRAMMLSLDEAGVPLAPRQVLHEGLHSGYGGPSLLGVGDAAFVGISHQLPDRPDFSREYTYVQRWTCSAEAEDLCRPQEAEIAGNGDCARGFLRGWRFDGEQCVPLYDCDSGCTGSDCDQLASSRFACESDRIECLVPTCADSASRAVEVCGPVTVPSGQPSWLDVSYGDESPCVCERPTCRVAPSGPLELTVHLEYCAATVPDCDCDFEPERPTVACAIPPLAAGTWTLRFDGREPLMLESQRGPIETRNGCR